MRKIVTISDTHNQHRCVKLPDYLEDSHIIHAGDATNFGTDAELKDFYEWFAEIPGRTKVFSPGNHEMGLYKKWLHPTVWAGYCKEVKEKYGIHIYVDETCTFVLDTDDDSVRTVVSAYFAPFTPKFGTWAWMYNKNTADLIWRNMPDDVSLIVTHGPAYGIRDFAPRGNHAGCPTLLRKLGEAQPLVHVHGHIHEAAGTHRGDWLTINTAGEWNSIDMSEWY